MDIFSFTLTLCTAMEITAVASKGQTTEEDLKLSQTFIHCLMNYTCIWDTSHLHYLTEALVKPFMVPSA